MPENKQEVKKLVKEELKKKGIEATDEVVEQLSEVAIGSVDGGMSVAGRVMLTVGGAAAVAALSAGGMYLGEKAYDKHKGLGKYNTKAVQDYEKQLLAGGTVLYDAEGKMVTAADRSKAVSYGGTGSENDESKRHPLPI